jgi:hypothetical protein
VKGDRVFDVIADIINPISNIAADKEAMELFKKKTVPEGMGAKAFLMERLKKSLPLLLKDHKKDLIAILSIIEGCTAEEYAEKLTLSTLFRDVADLLNDKAFMELFISAQTEVTSSASAPMTSAAGM